MTGLQTGTTYGRPPWDKIFLQHAERYQGQTVGVFFCGPKVLSKELAHQCKTFTDTRTNTKFVFKKVSGLAGCRDCGSNASQENF